ncbi:MAG: RluA family pseudouridine synthase [Myxococcota bacterium]
MGDATYTASWTTTEAFANARLDAFLAGQLPWRSRRSLVSMVRSGAAMVNGRAVKKAHRLALGDLVELVLPAAEIPTEEIAAVELPVLFEAEDLVVVNKPPGLAVHAAATCPHVHAISRLQLRYAREVADPTAEPSIIHRLDRGTSGVLAVARRRDAVAYYCRQFERRTVRKSYVAIVVGQPDDAGSIREPLRIEDCQPVVVDPDGRPCRTDFTVVERRGTLAMVHIELHTGRKHQIRVHFAALGFPLLFDDVYTPDHGPDSKRDAWPEDARPMLHAAQLTLTHRDEGPKTFDAPLPADMMRVWDAAEELR